MAFREGMEHGIESLSERFGYLLRINTRGGGRERRKRDAQNLRDFAVTQVAEKIVEEWQTVCSREQDVDGETNSESLRNLLEPSADGAGLCGDFFRTSGFGEVFAVISYNRDAGSRRFSANN